jgi:quaternary ammonium compound-resistance protein SugE
MAWLYLIVAGLLEIGWPVGLKMSQDQESRWLGISIAVAFMVASGFMLWLAQKQIPMGTSYAVWTGIGAAGTFLVGLLFYGDAATFGRIAGVLLIISGVITLKISH